MGVPDSVAIITVFKNIFSMLRLSINVKVDARGQLTGENIMYLYPDLYTCLVGKFQVRSQPKKIEEDPN